MEIIIAIFGVIGVIAAMLLYNTLAWALVAQKFYWWFILPTFTGLPSLTFLQCMGLCLFVGIFTRNKGDKIKDDYKDKTGAVTAMILSPWVTLFIGWILKIIFF